ncbi:hypothetical protein MH171_000107 [Vibrio parahaemolyticus]|uniref:hypothetical protein n=1 Tax=Vibrio parahaemolyticus TaxID=670 RepID=UPI0010AA9573|nr:hypothetical protein [Vibrio parahaemolyticus]EIW7860214.1 hypothetical protein [Vibrio parahaemolyticus]ELA7254674.1 hypothetical protein [Vibrio parahaemolyticus]EMF1837891.1 hypothetical protein [Vibrio parahaemolyticus]MBE4323086.1 hypothetical protein [Vibrio parahaemolyticus]MBE4341232.1 hypothetical protein [Vibrio parahaemolyticus]
MANLKQLRSLVADFEKRYRGASLEPFIYVEPYELECNKFWPEIMTTHRGVYGILHNDELLYIGKVTGKNRVLCHRINDYFVIRSDFSYGGSKYNWSKDPTHVVAWGVPHDSFFEASGLEDFLIDKLQNELPDNTRK